MFYFGEFENRRGPESKQRWHFQNNVLHIPSSNFYVAYVRENDMAGQCHTDTVTQQHGFVPFFAFPAKKS